MVMGVRDGFDVYEIVVTVSRGMGIGRVDCGFGRYEWDMARILRV